MPFMQTIRTKNLVIGGLAILILCLYTVYKKYDNYWKEIEWYTQNLDYDFTARVDSAIAFHENGNGFLYISLRSGELDKQREDSLRNLLKHYRLLRFLRTEKNILAIFSGSTDSFHTGDSVYVNSDKNQFLIFRDKMIIRDYNIHDYLTKRYF